MKEGQQNVVKDPHANPYWAESRRFFLLFYIYSLCPLGLYYKSHMVWGVELTRRSEVRSYWVVLVSKIFSGKSLKSLTTLRLSNRSELNQQRLQSCVVDGVEITQRPVACVATLINYNLSLPAWDSHTIISRIGVFLFVSLKASHL